jgi:putative endonuclease
MPEAPSPRSIRQPRRENARKGRDGEKRAREALEKQGMRIITANFHSPKGEVDIIARDGDTIAFIEVKAWSSFGLEDLQYGINEKKRRRIIETAKYFLAGHREYNEMAIRFDVVFVSPGAIDGASVRHLASAFVECV